MTDFDESTRTALEAAAFRRLVRHLRERGDEGSQGGVVPDAVRCGTRDGVPLERCRRLA